MINDTDSPVSAPGAPTVEVDSFVRLDRFDADDKFVSDGGVGGSPEPALSNACRSRPDRSGSVCAVRADTPPMPWAHPRLEQDSRMCWDRSPGCSRFAHLNTVYAQRVSTDSCGGSYPAFRLTMSPTRVSRWLSKTVSWLCWWRSLEGCAHRRLLEAVGLVKPVCDGERVAQSQGAFTALVSAEVECLLNPVGHRVA